MATNGLASRSPRLGWQPSSPCSTPIFSSGYGQGPTPPPSRVCPASHSSSSASSFLLPDRFLPTLPRGSPLRSLFRAHRLTGRLVTSQELPVEIVECAGNNPLAHLLHQLDRPANVVQTGEAVAKQLPGPEEVVQVGKRERVAGIAVAPRIDRSHVAPETGISNIDPPVASEQCAVATEACL